MPAAPSLDALLAEALDRPAVGWDFGWIRDTGRFEETPLPWSYDRAVRGLLAGSPDVLDLGTGGGERLASLGPRPVRTVATESYAPNLPVAVRRLGPLGVSVVRVAPSPDNVALVDPRAGPTLPFRDASFRLVIDRNEAYVPGEVARVLASGGTFVTEQSGSAALRPLLDLLGLPAPGAGARAWSLPLARRQLETVGMTIVESGVARPTMTFRDVGALVWYLRMAPWTAPGFRPATHRARLAALHARIERTGPIRVSRPAFWLVARR